jgi:neopullulanase
MRKLTFLACLVGFYFSSAQNIKLYPTNWYTGMKWNNVQIILRSDKAISSNATIQISYPGVSLKKVHLFENKKYRAFDLVVSATAKSGNVVIVINDNGTTTKLNWQLKTKRAGIGSNFAQGVTAKDLIYLIMPDRFSNGDPTNDKFLSYRDTVVHRKDPIKRHGGDLQGVANHMDYFKELGVTAIWLTPVLENDMPLEAEQAGNMAGYHGYWFTDHYAIDKRLGGTAAYKKMVDVAHANGIKVMQDAVYNHVGIEHWFYKDPPAKDWINQWNSYTNTNHREEAIFGNNGTNADKKMMLDGWFVPHLPDVNQRNPFVANFLIQHAIWCMEEFGIDGWRVDTYKYCDEPFLNGINTALEKEYPTVTIFGEATSNTVAGSAYFTNNKFSKGFKHNAQGVTDFPLSYAMMEAVNNNFGWTDGVNKLYMTLAQDILYDAPEKNCIFFDNHDMERLVSKVGEDMNKYKMAMNLLYTLRGIPQLYYGTEIWMKNFKDPNDGMVRLDFPGGFTGDETNKFTAAGRDAKEQEAFNYVKNLGNFRKNISALHGGKLVQYLPKDGVYLYFRTDAANTVMCVFNTSGKEKKVDFNDYQELTKGFTSAINIQDNKLVTSSFTMPAKTSIVLHLQK